MRQWTPTLAKRWIASELKRLRLAAALPQKAAADRLDDSQARISTLEKGLVIPRRPDLEALLPLYGQAERVQEFLDIREIAKQRNWWYGSEVVPSWFTSYLGFEEGASALEAWNDSIIHDLLQTAEYATAQIRETRPTALAKEIADLVDIRMRRQEILAARTEDPCQLRIILSEAALRVPVGSTTVMSDQYDHLLNLASSTVELQVLPLAAGPHVAPFSPFTLLSFDIPDDAGVLYTEGPDGGHYNETAADITNTRDIFETLWTTALNPTESINFIKNLKAELVH